MYAATRKQTRNSGRGPRCGRARLERGALPRGTSRKSAPDVANRFADRALDLVVATNAFGTWGSTAPTFAPVLHVQPPSSIRKRTTRRLARAGRDGSDQDDRGCSCLCSGTDIRACAGNWLVTTGSDGALAPRSSRRRAWALFRELLRYLDQQRTCRHDFILRHFGDDERELLGGCGHCDICVRLDERAPSADEGEDEATATVVRMALSAVARARRRAGLIAIAEMLCGVDGERTRRFGFVGLSTFGLLRDRTQPWVTDLLRGLLAAGWIDLTPTDHPVPLLTTTGAEVMRGKAPVRFALPLVREREPSRGASGKRAPGSRAASPALESLQGEARERFERLRTHRAQVAKSRGVPAYVVALDRTLLEMATQPPQSLTQLLEIFGMGPARVEQYGDGFPGSTPWSN